MASKNSWLSGSFVGGKRDMRRYLVFEIKRSIFSYPFLIGWLIAMAGIAAWTLPKLQFASEMGALRLFLWLHDGYISLLAPVIATIPFAQSYAIERNSGFSRFVMQRLSLARYQTAKLVSNALAGGLVLVIPLVSALIWVTAKYPMTVPDPNGNPPFFQNLDPPDPLVHMGLLIGLGFLFGATYATVGLATSVLFRNPYYANVIPFAIYIVFGFLFGLFGLGYLEPSVMWRPSNNTFATPATVALQYLVVWSISLFVYIRFFRAKEE